MLSGIFPDNFQTVKKVVSPQRRTKIEKKEFVPNKKAQTLFKLKYLNQNLMGTLALQGFSLFSAATLSSVPTYADENASAKCNFLF